MFHDGWFWLIKANKTSPSLVNYSHQKVLLKSKLIRSTLQYKYAKDHVGRTILRIKVYSKNTIIALKYDFFLEKLPESFHDYFTSEYVLPCLISTVKD